MHDLATRIRAIADRIDREAPVPGDAIARELRDAVGSVPLDQCHGILESCVADAAQRWGASMDEARELETWSFQQTWGDTSLGFGGVGGQMMTAATTVVVHDPSLARAAVFFASRYAYSVEPARGAFFRALQDHRMPSVRDRSTLLGD